MRPPVTRDVAPDPPRAGDDPVARALLPVGRSGWAIAAGYLGLLVLVLDGVWVPYLLLQPAKKLDVLGLLYGGGPVVLAMSAPTVLCAALGHRAIRRDPHKHGMVRVGFAYAAVGLLVAGLLVGMARAATARRGAPMTSPMTGSSLAPAIRSDHLLAAPWRRATARRSGCRRRGARTRP